MEGEINLARYFKVFFRRFWVFSLIFCGIVGFTAIKTYRTPKIYTSIAKVLIKRYFTAISEKSRVIEEVFGVETNCEILQTKDFIERVVKYMKENGKELEILNLPNPSERILSMTTITPLENTNIIEIKITGSNPDELPIIANSIAETFQSYSLEIAKGRLLQQKRFIESQLPIIREELKKSEKGLRNFKEKELIVSLPATREALQAQLEKLNSEYEVIVTKISMNKDLISYLEKQLSEKQKELPEKIAKSDNPFLIELSNQLLSLEKEYSSYLLAGKKEEHPEMKALREKIDEAKEKLKIMTKERINGGFPLVNPMLQIEEIAKKIAEKIDENVELEINRKNLKEKIEKQTEYLRKFPEKEAKLMELERAVEFNRNIYTQFLTTYEEIKLAEVGEFGGVVIVDRAIRPPKPVSPSILRNILLALLMGLGLGIAGVILMEHLDNSFKEVEEIEENKIPVLGVVPVYSEDISKFPTSVPSELYKKIRINLIFSLPKDIKLNSLLISSCMPKEGKSTVSIDIAKTYAMAGDKVLLIDGDLRHPVLDKKLSIKNENGLSDIVVGKVNENEAIIETGLKNFYFLSAGNLPPDPTKLIASNSMKELIERLKEKFSIIIIDSPPISSCADPILLGKLVDGLCLVVELKRTPKNIVRKTIENIENMGINFVGIIVNKVKLGGGYYGYYYSRYYTKKV